jgi:hypothetical protein
METVSDETSRNIACEVGGFRRRAVHGGEFHLGRRAPRIVRQRPRLSGDIERSPQRICVGNRSLSFQEAI